MRQPVGVVVGIAPWNAPVILGTRAIASPLALGNTVVLKASEECPRTHAAIVHALVDAGTPTGVVNLIVNAPADAADVVDELIAHPAVRRDQLHRLDARRPRSWPRTRRDTSSACCSSSAARRRWWCWATPTSTAPSPRRTSARSSTQGQICMSTERIVVDRSVADEFAAKLGEKASALKVGDPHEHDTQIGPLVNEAAVKRVGELVDDAVAKGAR